MAEEPQEKVFTVPFRNVLSAPQRARADRAVTEVRSFVSRQLKVPARSVKVGAALNERIWENGAKEIPKKLKIHTKLSGEFVLAELADVPFPADVGEKKKKEEKPAKEAEKGTPAKEPEKK